jgi:hypothetical protein
MKGSPEVMAWAARSSELSRAYAEELAEELSCTLDGTTTIHL